MRKRGGESWNSEFIFFRVKNRVSLGIARRLEDICQSLTLPGNQGDVMGFLANPKNTQRINSLIEDVNEVLMVYRVCGLDDSCYTCLTFVLDIIATRYL